MKRWSILLMLLVIARTQGEVRGGEKNGSFPFETVELRGGEIIVTLPATGIRWQVEDAAGKRRETKPGEAFALKAGATLRLVEMLSSYDVTAHLVPEAGAQITGHFLSR